MTTAAPVADAISRIPLRTKFFFGLGAMAEGIALTAIGGYAMLFYNQVLGVDPILAGLAISASLVLDGFADPIVGSLSDRTRHRLGRRHLYMYLAPLPVALSLLAIFNPPETLAGLWLFAWFAAFVVTLRVCMAAYHVPHLALGGEMSPDYTERSRIMSWNNLMGMLGVSGTSFVALTFFFHKTPEYPRGVLNPEAYAPFSIAAASVGFLCLMASAWYTRDRIKLAPPVPDDVEPFSPFAFFKDLGAAFANRNYLWLLIAYFFLSLMLGVRQGLNLYVNTFFWDFTSEQIRWFVIGTITGYFAGFYVTAWLHGRFDKKIAIVVTCVALSAIPSIPIYLRLIGVAPPPGDPSLLGFVITFAGLAAMAGSIMNISVMSALADIADENEVKMGFRQEGVLYSTRALFSKLDSAIGHFFASVALAVIAFPEKAKPGEVKPEVLEHLGWVDGPVAMIPGLVAAFFYARYRINKDSYEKTKATLADLRRARSGEPALAPGGTGETIDPAPG